MKHTSSHPAQILMSGHNPEHSHSHKSHGGISHASNMKPAEHLMRQNHAHGGGIGRVNPYAAGGGIGSAPRFAKGGHCYAEGGEAEKEYGGEKPLSGQLHKGGRAKRQPHMWGESSKRVVAPFRPDVNSHRGIRSANPVFKMPVDVDQGLSKGGRAKRQHHYWGQDVFGRIPLIGDLATKISGTVGTLEPDKFGGSEYVAKSPAEKMLNVATTGHMKKGGLAKKRQHHWRGDEVGPRKNMMHALWTGAPSLPKAGAPVGDNSVRAEHKRGGSAKKRQHHYWGQDLIGRLPIVGGLANTIAGHAGTLDNDQYGGANYVADTPGRKAADVISHLGDFGANLALNYAGVKRSRGGKVNHHAAGGAAKVRRGMMTNSGHMIHHKV